MADAEWEMYLNLYTRARTNENQRSMYKKKNLSLPKALLGMRPAY